MKSKLIKIAGLAFFSITCYYISSNWDVFKSTSSIEPKHVELSQYKLDISELKTDTSNPIWYVKTENPTVAYNIVFKNEGKRSFQEHPGILTIIDNTLMDGAGDYDSFELKKAFIDNNISFSVNFDEDDAVIAVYTTAENFSLSVDLVTTILTKAHLSPQKLEKNKEKRLIQLSQSKFSASFMAAEKLSQMMFEEAHPYRIDLNKTLKKIPTYTKADFDHSYSKLFAAEDALVTFVGSVSKEEVTRDFSKLLSTLSKSKKNNFQSPKQKVEFNNCGKYAHVDVDTSQSTVCFALPIASKTSQDRFACRLANNILGGAATIFTTRLFKDVRDKHGLTYGIYTSCDDDDLVAALYGHGDTSPENADKLITRVKAVFQEFIDKGITQDELDYQKTAYFSKNVLESAQNISRFVTSCRMDNIECKYVNNYLNNYYNLTLDDVSRVIKNYFNPSKLVFASAGKHLEKDGR